MAAQRESTTAGIIVALLNTEVSVAMANARNAKDIVIISFTGGHALNQFFRRVGYGISRCGKTAPKIGTLACANFRGNAKLSYIITFEHTLHKHHEACKRRELHCC